MRKPTLARESPVRVIRDFPTYEVSAGTIGWITRDFGENVDPFPDLQGGAYPPGTVHRYGVRFHEIGRTRRFILCDAEIEPLD